MTRAPQKEFFCFFSSGRTSVAEAEDRGAVRMPPNVFGQENLSDCGFSEKLLNHFCNPDPARIEIFESFKFLNGLYTWS